MGMTRRLAPPLTPRRTSVSVLFAVVNFLLSALCPLAWTADVAQHSFDLPADLAESSLKKFAAQSGTEVVFASSTAGKVRTNAVKGDYTPREALNRLVANTSLSVVENARTGALMIHSTASPKNSAPPSSPSTQTNEGQKRTK